MSIATKVKNIQLCAVYRKRWKNAVNKIDEAWADGDPDTMKYYAEVANKYLEKYLELKYEKVV